MYDYTGQLDAALIDELWIDGAYEYLRAKYNSEEFADRTHWFLMDIVEWRNIDNKRKRICESPEDEYIEWTLT